MLLNPVNFLKHIKNLVTGDEGFNKDNFLPVGSFAVGNTNMATAALSNSLPATALVLDTDADNFVVPFRVPRDYDEHADELTISVLARNASGTSDTLQPSAVTKGNPEKDEDLAALSGFSAPTATTINAGFKIGEVPVTLSGFGLERGDLVFVNYLVGGTTGSGITHVLGAKATYRSTLVSYNETDSSGNQLR
jgi:hypothetical protein